MGRKRHPDPVKNCKMCGKMLERKRYGGKLESMLAFKKRPYCDRSCMAKFFEGRIKVSNPRNSRRQAKKRREQHCCICGTPDGQLSAHHADGNPMNNDKANVVTLCQSCHMKEHWKEWRKTIWQPKKCSYCERRARRNGMCGLHWQRFKKHGSPHIVVKWVNGQHIPVTVP
jgi:hypothetical protein